MDPAATHGPRIENKTNASLFSLDFCQNVVEASELTTHAQRVASALDVSRANA